MKTLTFKQLILILVNAYAIEFDCNLVYPSVNEDESFEVTIDDDELYFTENDVKSIEVYEAGYRIRFEVTSGAVYVIQPLDIMKF